MNNKKLQSFLYKIYNISSRVQYIRSTDITLKTGTKINSIALSTLDVISKHPDKNMTEISNIMGVTKGAISQMALKLQKKGLIQKNKSEQNGKNNFMSLSYKGKESLDEYYLMHDQLYQGISELLSNYQKEEIETIERFLCQTNDFLDRYKTNTYNNYESEILNKRKE